MALGIDYSWARPGAARIRKAGYEFVVRYIPYEGNGGKGIEADEIADLRDNDIKIVIVFESYSNRALEGYSAGREDAQVSQTQLERVGLDIKMPVYFAIDFDVKINQFQAVEDYLRGVSSILGIKRTGVYGDYSVIELSESKGLAEYYWQTCGWSEKKIHPKAHLYQYGINKNLNGPIDINNSMKSYYGQERLHIK